MRLRFTSPALEEVAAALAYLSEQENDAAARLLQSIDAATALIEQNPEIAAPDVQATRGLRLSDFPYTMWYRIERNEIAVYAFAHHRRNAGYWLDRLR